MMGNTVLLAVVFILLFVIAWRVYFQPGWYAPPGGVAFNLTIPGYLAGVALSPEEGRAEGRLVVDSFHSAKPVDAGELTSRVAALGYSVEYALKEGELAEKLRGASALLLILPKGLSEDEMGEVEGFAASGGRLLLLADPDIESEAGAVAARLGLSFGGGYAYNMKENAGNYKYVLATQFDGESALADGMGVAAFYTACPVDGKAVGFASAGTAVFPSPPAERVGLVAEKGNATAICDVHFLQPPYAFAYDNQRLIQNLARFLTSGRRVFGLVDFPAVVSRSTTIFYANESLLHSALLLKKEIAGSEVRKMGEEARAPGDVVALGFFEGGRGMGPVNVSDAAFSIQGIGEFARGEWAVAVLERGEGANVLLVAGENASAVEAAVGKLVEGKISEFEAKPGIALVPVKAPEEK